MDATKPHGFFLASFLVLMFLGDLTEACGPCPEISLQDACCKHDFVMRVQFINVRRDPDFPIYLNMFTIQPVQVFKGSGAQVLYSPEDKLYCGYQHKGPLRGEEYLISGLIDDIGPQITKCHLAIPWNEVTNKDKMTLHSLAGRDCSFICTQL